MVPTPSVLDQRSLDTCDCNLRGAFDGEPRTRAAGCRGACSASSYPNRNQPRSHLSWHTISPIYPAPRQEWPIGEGATCIVV